MLTSIELTGFRGFHQLKLEGLQRVNLIVGKNNSGKTSLLEGIERFGRGAEKKLSRLRVVDNEMENLAWQVNDQHRGDGASVSINGGHSKYSVTIIDGNAVATNQGDRVAIVTLPIQQKSPSDLSNVLASAIRIQGAEDLLVNTLHEVDPRITKIRTVPGKDGIILDIGLSELVPVSLVGQGIYRLLDIYSEVISSKAKVCLIDEIENGIHHTSLIDLWRGLADAAERFDVQIFATTHSHECVEAAHEAFSERPSYDLSVIQLFRKTVSVQGRVLDQEHIAAALDGKIDLRG